MLLVDLDSINQPFGKQANGLCTLKSTLIWRSYYLNLGLLIVGDSKKCFLLLAAGRLGLFDAL